MHEGIFLCYLLWEPIQDPRGKAHNIVKNILKQRPPGVLISWDCPTKPQHFINFTSGFSTLVLVFAVVSLRPALPYKSKKC